MALIDLLTEITGEEKKYLVDIGTGLGLGALLGAYVGVSFELLRYISHVYNPSLLEGVCEVAYPTIIAGILGAGFAGLRIN